jgi:transcriptional regulator with GAF, ATPase, and Fis domain
VPGSVPGRRSSSETSRRGSDGPADERRQIEDALAGSRGRVYGAEGAAETLGVPPSTLEARIRRLAIDKHAFRRRVPEQQ